MVRYAMLLSVYLFECVDAMDFMRIVSENSSAPDRIVEKMKEICEEKSDLEDVATAFLDNFGGKDFEPRQIPMCKDCSQEVRDQLRDAALLIGRDMRKLGKDSTDEAGLRNLRIAMRFMKFAESGGYSFFDDDVSKSFAVDELCGMIGAMEQYLGAVKNLKEHVEEKKMVKIPEKADNFGVLDGLSDDES